MTAPARTDRTALAGVGIAALAVVCCAAGPLLLAFAGSLAVGALVGIGAAVTLLVMACGALCVRHRCGMKRPGSRS